MTTMAGMLHDRYLRGALLGAGGMGEVFEGYDRLLARRVAIKVLVYPYGRDPVFLARFEREAQAAAGLGHPNIVNVYDIGEQDGLHFMVMSTSLGARCVSCSTPRESSSPIARPTSASRSAPR